MKLDGIIKYRNVWMTLAIFWVILFHSSLIVPNSIFFIKQIGYGGVDIFMFASGLGCFYSLSKNSSINDFLKRRFEKLMPTFWCFLVVFILYKKFHGGIGISAIIGNILCLQAFTFKDNSFNWYIGCIWLFYFLAPYIYFHTKEIKSHFRAILFTVLLLVFSIPFIRCNNLIVMATRLPIFFIGMYFGKLSKEKDFKLSLPYIILFIISMIIGFVMLKYFFVHYSKYLWSHGLYWYPFILITPGLCICISLLCMLMDKNIIGKFFLKIFTFIGNNTFELYLVHVFLFEIVQAKIKSGELTNSNLLWLKSLAIVIVATIVLKYVTKLVVFIWKKMCNIYSMLVKKAKA